MCYVYERHSLKKHNITLTHALLSIAHWSMLAGKGRFWYINPLHFSYTSRLLSYYCYCSFCLHQPEKWWTSLISSHIMLLSHRHFDWFSATMNYLLGSTVEWKRLFLLQQKPYTSFTQVIVSTLEDLHQTWWVSMYFWLQHAFQNGLGYIKILNHFLLYMLSHSSVNKINNYNSSQFNTWILHLLFLVKAVGLVID